MADALKDQFGPAVVRRLSGEIGRVHKAFDRKQFERAALRGFESLELLDRGRHLGTMLHRYLPGDFAAAVDILLATLPAERDPSGGMASFFYLPHTEFVRGHGLAHFEDSMRALHALTQRFTGEFAMRPFLEHQQAATLERLDAWTQDANAHVRRLVSESTRPRLPWAPRLRAFQKDPTPMLRLLEKLRDDPALYVRRSVANNLNDVGKDHPALLVATAKRWMDGASGERQWIVKHALRSVVKHGDAAALAVLGYAASSRLDVVESTIAPARPTMGGRVTVTCTLHNPSKRVQRAIVDLRVHFVKANGGTGPKVFKLSTVALAAGQRISLRKTVSLADLSTRRHYPGTHEVELQMNGVATRLGSFALLTRR